MSERTYFGTDGIRGRVGQWPITADFMLRLGRAAGVVLGEQGGDRSILIGKDTRLSGYMFESALEAGLIAAGAHVRLLGPMPTPAVSYLTRYYGASAGIVISASHNPHHDNGIKFFSAQGQKLSDALERRIEVEIGAPFTTVDAAQLGKARRMLDAAERYLSFLKESVPSGVSLSGMRIAVDCANGANYALAPRLLSELGAEVVAVGVQPDGTNINQACGSTDPGSLVRLVQEQQAQLGLAFDGDGDRLIMVDERGGVVDGDAILYLLARDWRATGRLQGPVIGTLMTNFGLELALRAQGIAFERARVGDRYVHQLLVERAGILGGEASGHILCLDRAPTGDALLCALQVLEVVQRHRKPLSQLAAEWQRLPQKTINVHVPNGSAPLDHPSVQYAKHQAEQQLAERGRIILRASGTEPVIRVTAEAEDATLVDAVLHQLSAAVRAAI